MAFFVDGEEYVLSGPFGLDVLDFDVRVSLECPRIGIEGWYSIFLVYAETIDQLLDECYSRRVTVQRSTDVDIRFRLLVDEQGRPVVRGTGDVVGAAGGDVFGRDGEHAYEADLVIRPGTKEACELAERLPVVCGS